MTPQIGNCGIIVICELLDEKYGQTFEIELPEEKHDRTFEIKSCQTKSTTKLLELRVARRKNFEIEGCWMKIYIAGRLILKNGQNCPEFFLRNGTVMQFRKISVYA
ncbi:unnamed protein product [Rhizophagus irregularis]|nr:unnamed protein product [Rhizophagus irregularis]